MDGNEETNPIALTLSAMEGAVGINSVRLIGTINGKQVGFLVDTGTTHNFIDPRTVYKLHLEVSGIDSFYVGEATRKGMLQKCDDVHTGPTQQN